MSYRVQAHESSEGIEDKRLHAYRKEQIGLIPGPSIEWAKILLIPLVIAVIGYFFAAWPKERDETENKVRLYTQLISQREQSDSQLRTEMFKAVIEKCLSGGKSGDLHDTVLKLV